MLFFLVDATNVELQCITLCKWVSSDDPEKNSGEAKAKGEELSPTKAESPLALNQGKSLKSSFICFSTSFIVSSLLAS